MRHRRHQPRSRGATGGMCRGPTTGSALDCRSRREQGTMVASLGLVTRGATKAHGRAGRGRPRSTAAPSSCSRMWCSKATSVVGMAGGSARAWAAHREHDSIVGDVEVKQHGADRRGPRGATARGRALRGRTICPKRYGRAGCHFADLVDLVPHAVCTDSPGGGLPLLLATPDIPNATHHEWPYGRRTLTLWYPGCRKATTCRASDRELHMQ